MLACWKAGAILVNVNPSYRCAIRGVAVSCPGAGGWGAGYGAPCNPVLASGREPFLAISVVLHKDPPSAGAMVATQRTGAPARSQPGGCQDAGDADNGGVQRLPCHPSGLVALCAVDVISSGGCPCLRLLASSHTDRGMKVCDHVVQELVPDLLDNPEGSPMKSDALPSLRSVVITGMLGRAHVCVCVWVPVLVEKQTQSFSTPVRDPHPPPGLSKLLLGSGGTAPGVTAFDDVYLSEGSSGGAGLLPLLSTFRPEATCNIQFTSGTTGGFWWFEMMIDDYVDDDDGDDDDGDDSGVLATAVEYISFFLSANAARPTQGSRTLEPG